MVESIAWWLAIRAGIVTTNAMNNEDPMLPQNTITVFSDCHSTANVPEELERLWQEKNVSLEDLHHEATAFFVKHQSGSVAEIYAFFEGSRSVAANDELLDALVAASAGGEALMAAEEARYLFVRDVDPEITLIERPMQEPKFDIHGARYDRGDLEDALTRQRLAIGHFRGTPYLFNEKGDTVEMSGRDGMVDTKTFFERLEEIPEELLEFVGSDVVDALQQNKSAYRA